jgi:hypothetical protein
MTPNKFGPYAKTKINRAGYLDILNIIPVPAEDNDVSYEITAAYHHRPDLLAYDLYGKKELWWVFAQRNLDVIKDPIYDFTAGTQIYLPKLSNLTKTIGV